MTRPVLRVAVVGHTNTGKTSLMRTLMRDVRFGDVVDGPAVTRDVEGAVLRAGGESVVQLFDTPGLEDSVGLLETLDARRGERRLDGLDVIREFLDSVDAIQHFSQERKALRQVLASDVALYVIDARDRVLAKHSDELEVLGRCARPIVPVLNFTAVGQARTADWRAHLARVNMHAVAEFDTVVFDLQGEERLFEKMRTLLDARGEALKLLMSDRAAERHNLIRSSAGLVAELLVDVSTFAVVVPSDAAESGRNPRMKDLKQVITRREQRCVERLLALHRFRAGDVESGELPIENGVWGFDLFSPAALRQFGLHTGGAAATGAMVGLTLDVAFAGLSLGTGMGAGALIGSAFGLASAHGRRMLDRTRGLTELRCDRATLELLAVRQIVLVRALLRRGHAAMGVVRLQGKLGDDGRIRIPRDVLRVLANARVHPQWSRLGVPRSASGVSEPARRDAVEHVERGIASLFEDGFASAGTLR